MLKFKHRQNEKSIIFEKGVILDKHTKFEGYNRIFNNTVLRACDIGLGTYVSSNSKLYNVKVGRFCSIANHVITGLSKHPSRDFVSTHPAFYSLGMQAGFTFVKSSKFKEYGTSENEKFRIIIGHDVWVGAYVLIMDEVTIGNGSIVAAGAVVTKDVEPYSIVGGVPARHLRFRFCDQDKEYLEKYKWWDKDFQWIKANSSTFVDIERFKNEL